MNQTSSTASLLRRYLHFVWQNVLSMLAVSCYILADTFFIARADGADGITALNLCLPVYSLIYAIGAMLGVGAATRFSILRAQDSPEADRCFSGAVLWALVLSVPFTLAGLLCPGRVLAVMGGDAQIRAVGLGYVRTFLPFAPTFMLGSIFSAFMRNDGAPGLAMAATLCSNAFNILFDYIFVFPMGMGMQGAALATAISPLVNVAVCSLHFGQKNCGLHFVCCRPTLRRLADSCRLGISAFVGELSSAVTTIVFNLMILRLAGNTGVAAYGIVANLALVATAIFNGIANGAQPLVSDRYGHGDTKGQKQLLLYSLYTALLAFAGLYAAVFGGAEAFTALFNSEGSAALAALAVPGLRLYFIGFLFAGVNISLLGWLSASDEARIAAVGSICRGVGAITGCALLLGSLFGITGIWLAFPAAEALTLALLGALCQKMRRDMRKI